MDKRAPEEQPQLLFFKVGDLTLVTFDLSKLERAFRYRLPYMQSPTTASETDLPIVIQQLVSGDMEVTAVHLILEPAKAAPQLVVHRSWDVTPQ